VIVGNLATFAIESHLSVAYDRLSARGLGFFVLHIGGLEYGVREPMATLLACSLDAVGERLKDRGKHTAAFADQADGGIIAAAVTNAVYDPDESRYPSAMSVPINLLLEELESARLIWAPDGDAAFDDGSSVLQLDAGDQSAPCGF
jgi:Immunity protein 42